MTLRYCLEQAGLHLIVWMLRKVRIHWHCIDCISAASPGHLEGEDHSHCESPVVVSTVSSRAVS
jgi:hypothetical protein